MISSDTIQLVANWFRRSAQRQRELQAGVDADLLRANSRRWKWSALLFACGFGLLGIEKLVAIAAGRQHVINIVSGAFIAVGLGLALWARDERAFLDKPDPEESPRLWK